MGNVSSSTRIAVIPAVALAGAAVVGAIYFLIPSNSHPKAPENQVESTTSTPEQNPLGKHLLSKDEILEFIQVFRKMYAADYKIMQKNHVVARRAFYEVDDEKYADEVVRFTQESPKLFDVVITKTLEQFDVSHTSFEESIDAQNSDSQIIQAFQSLHTNVQLILVEEGQTFPPELTEKVFEEKLRETTLLLDKKLQEKPPTSQIDALVLTAEVSDELFKRYPFDEAEDMAASLHYAKSSNPNIQRSLQRLIHLMRQTQV